MKCPYTTNSIQVVRHKCEYNDDLLCIFEETNLQENHPFVDCVEAECAAWVGGKCEYRGAVD